MRKSLTDSLKSNTVKTNMYKAKRKAYKKYLKSEAWAIIKKQIHERDNYTCQKCLKKPSEHIHHLTYKNFGNEKPEDLLALCESCHSEIHKKKLTPHSPKFYQFSEKYKKNYIGNKSDILIVIEKLKEVAAKRLELERSSVKSRFNQFNKILDSQEDRFLQEKERLEKLYLFM